MLSIPPPTRWSSRSRASRVRTELHSLPTVPRSMSAMKSIPTLDVFDRKSGTLVKKVALSAHPNNIAVAKDGRIVVGIARDPGALDIIDPATLTRTKSVPVHGRLHNVYVTPDSKYVVTGSIQTGIVTVIDLATRAARVGGQARQGHSPDGNRGQSGWLDQANLRPIVRLQRIRSGGFCRAQGSGSGPATGGKSRVRDRWGPRHGAFARHRRRTRRQDACG